MGFSKILIANRGEIACRVIRTARNLGYRTVAVYSDADANAPHVMQADEAICIGAAPASESYLRIDKLLAAAKQTGADAIHPGYGFLSERADFSQACYDAGLVFIGPAARSIESMGNKALAKRRMIAAGVPCAPGYLGEQQDDASLIAEAVKMGFPLLVKAVAGGGGRGMRLVHQASELPNALAGARREAQSAFGDGTLMLERLILKGRHIEIQIFADAHGHAVYLGERDCTAQRRRQKVIEEAPSPVVSTAMREAMGKDAVAAALAVGYLGAGTVEFIVDDRLNHYFLEMNTRLQVEHPVTECITGLDLVEWQLRVAAGEPLPLQQSEIRYQGHAIEARLYAENPYEGFKPQTGSILWWRPELALHAGVRIDHGITEGGEVTPFYDAMVAKIIVHGRDRDDAIRRLSAALEDAPLLGLANNSRFLRDLVQHPEFRHAQMHTTRIDEWFDAHESILIAPEPEESDWVIAAAIRVLIGHTPAQLRPDSVATYDLHLVHGSQTQSLRVSTANRTATITINGNLHNIALLNIRPDGRLNMSFNGIIKQLIAINTVAKVHIVRDAATFVFHEPSAYPDHDKTIDPRKARVSVAGVVAQISVAVGDWVKEGQQLLCVEAMKMEMWLTAAATGRISAIHTNLRDSVAAGSTLVEIDTEMTQQP